jgi:diguanylate cyclase (GGDEF)-like protein
MSLSEAIKNTLAVFKETKEPITPDNYQRVFCAEAKRVGLNLPDCQFASRAIASLAPRLQAEAEAYRVRTKEELAAFLISRLNRAAAADRTSAFNSASSIVHSLLKILEATDCESLSAEARFSLARDIGRPIILQDEKTRWSKIETQFLSSVATAAKTDLTAIAKLFALVLQRVAGSSDEIKKSAKKLRDDPSVLSSPEFLREIEEALRRDDTIGERAKELEAMLKEFQEGLSAQSAQSGELHEAIERSEIGENKESWGSLKASFVAFGRSLKERLVATNALRDKVAALEDQLAESREEALRDATTKAPNRRAVNAGLEEREALYDREGTDYAAAFLEIDGFEDLLTNLGVGSSETVLGIVADVLSKTLPQNSAYGHYIGHAFLALFFEPTKARLEIALDSIVSTMASKRFVYESRSFAVTFSVGAALRSKSKSEADCLSAADASLRLAKLSGGNNFKAAL